MKPGHILLASLLIGLAGAQGPTHAQDEFRGPFRISRTTMEVGGIDASEGLKEIFAVDEELQWQVYVPENYDRRKPAGVLVYVDPGGWGGMPDEYRPLFNSLNMIWIGANRTGSKSSPAKTLWATKLGARAIQQDYAIDLDRMYLAGTGSGTITAMNAMLSSSEFVGIVQIGASISPDTIPAEYLDTLKRKYYVFMTSNNDKGRTAVRASYEKFKKAGFENVKLIYDMQGTRSVQTPELIDEAIRYMDSRLN